MSEIQGIKAEIASEVARISKQIALLEDPKSAVVAVQSGIPLSQKAALTMALHKALEHCKEALALCEPSAEESWRNGGPIGMARSDNTLEAKVAWSGVRMWAKLSTDENGDLLVPRNCLPLTRATESAARGGREGMNIVLIILVVLLLFGGGYGILGGNEAFGPSFGYGSGGLGLILLIVLLVILLRGAR